MRRGLYRTMALMNIRSSRKFYLPFLISIIMMGAMFYSMSNISHNAEFTGHATVRSVLFMGIIIIGLFVTIFIFYTNSFLMKRRKRELGLYHILGLEKRHVARILIWETFLLALAGCVGSLTAGLLLDRMMFLILLRIFRYPPSVPYQIGLSSILATVLLLGAVFFLVLLFNIWQVGRSSAIELLQSRSAGEREPKARWLLALLGLGCVGGGYYLSVTADNIVLALSWLFFAVLLVMAGTYLLFMVGSVAILKLLRKKKNYYYRTNHFVAVSGLIYRMKQNAVGLANICILSTGVLLVISTTVCLYAGIEDILLARFPTEIYANLQGWEEEENAAFEDLILETAAGRAVSLENYSALHSLDVTLALEDGKLTPGNESTTYSQICNLQFVTAQDYEKISGRRLQLAKDEVVLEVAKGRLVEPLVVLGETFQVKEILPEFSLGNDYSTVSANCYTIVVADQKVMQRIDKLQRDVYKEDASTIKYRIGFDVPGSEEDAVAFYEELLLQIQGREMALPYLECRYVSRVELYQLYGSMLFLGVYLGVLFLMATVLIIYYKQIIEGYEDRERYVIMKNVGMDRREIRRCISSQILVLFFLPLCTALLHCTAAFPIMRCIMEGFYMNNVWLFAGVTAAVAGVFTVGYVAVYALTARSYYHIVS